MTSEPVQDRTDEALVIAARAAHDELLKRQEAHETTGWRALWEGQRAMWARGILRLAIWMLPASRTRDELTAYADAWRAGVARRMADAN